MRTKQLNKLVITYSLALCALIFSVTGCGKAHDQTLSINCTGTSVTYSLNQYVDRKDDGTCVSNGHTASFQYRYDGDAERYQDLCVIDGMSIRYIDGIAKVSETGEVLGCK